MIFIYQFTTFAISGSKLIERIRLKMFECLLRQEIAYYDRPENTSSAINVRLCTDALAIEQVVGTRLGVMCETLALCSFGLLLGMFFSWQLTMIVALIVLIVVVAAYLNAHLNVRLRKNRIASFEGETR